MLGFVNNWFAPRANPIGVDFGSDSLRLAQVQYTGIEHRLIAAASADVPSHVRHDAIARFNWFIETTRDLLAQGKFRGRQAILALPAASIFIQHLRLAKMDDAETRKALHWEARGKLPIDPSHALLRHMVAGEVFNDTEPKQEIILMAAARSFVDQLLQSAGKAKLDVIGMNIEPLALLNCFSHVYRRKTDADATNCFVDIGSVGTRATITRGSQVLFCRSIQIGGDHFAQAVSAELKIGIDDARMLRLKACHATPTFDEAKVKRELDNASDTLSNLTPACPDVKAEVNSDQSIENAMHRPLGKLVEELNLCRRYYESTFPTKPVDRLIFVGGEARQRSLCQAIAKGMQLAAQIGDPMVRMGRISEIGMESGIDRRQPQPAWAVAIGLSMGPVGVPELSEVSN